MPRQRLYDERKAQPVDKHVGRRIRMRRAMLDISQERMAELLGVTFQQVQKYERGMNRVSASRLYEIARILNTTVDYFYEEFKEGRRGRAVSDKKQKGFVLDEALYTKETLDLVKIYYGLEDEDKRRRLLKIIRSMVETMKDED